MNYKREKSFKNCKICDFEWHVDDGIDCPVCLGNKIGTKKYTGGNWLGGMYGSGGNARRLNLIYRAVGLIALVLLLYALFGGKM